MKILILNGRTFDPADPAAATKVRNMSDAYALNLAREMSARGIRVTFANIPPPLSQDQIAADQEARLSGYYAKVGMVDHAICMSQNGFERRHPLFLQLVRRQTRGKVVTVFDHDRGDGGEDLVVHARRPTGYRGTRAAYTGWAADHRLFVPAKEDGWLTVYVDNKYMVDPSSDWTEALLDDAMRFCRDYEAHLYPRLQGKRRARVIFHSCNGLEVIQAPEVRRFRFADSGRDFAKRLPQPEIAAAFGKADMYLVTHTETMGLATLEAAMAGALIVAPNGFIRPELIRPLHHVTFERTPDWRHALAMLDVTQSVRLASEFTWPRLVDRLLAALTRGTDATSGLLLGDVGDLREWRRIGCTRKLALLSGDKPLTFIAKSSDGLHQIRGSFSKPPWPVFYSASFDLSVQGCSGIAISFASPMRKGVAAEAHFDLTTGRVRRSTGAGGWEPAGAAIEAIGESRFRCRFQAMSNYLPGFEARLALLQGTLSRFAPDVRTSLQIHEARLSSGISS